MAGKAAPSYRWYDTPALGWTVLGGVGVGVGTGVGVGAGGVEPPLPHMQGQVCGTPLMVQAVRPQTGQAALVSTHPGVGVRVGTGVGVGAGGGVGVAPPLPHMQGHVCGTPP